VVDLGEIEGTRERHSFKTETKLKRSLSKSGSTSRSTKAPIIEATVQRMLNP
jgi:hypothetical protein